MHETIQKNLWLNRMGGTTPNSPPSGQTELMGGNQPRQFDQSSLNFGEPLWATMT